MFGSKQDKKVKLSVEKEIRKAKKEAEMIRINSEKRLKIKIDEFIETHT